METDFILLSSNGHVGQVLCNCGHVEEVNDYDENAVVVCELCGSEGGVI
jgi:hypothetical protein